MAKKRVLKAALKAKRKEQDPMTATNLLSVDCEQRPPLKATRDDFILDLLLLFPARN